MEVSEEVGINQTTLSMYENGHRNMSAYNVILLAKYYKVSTDQILGLQPLIETRVFDIREEYDDCTVEILRNSITGETSFAWHRNDKPPVRMFAAGEE